MIDESLSDRQEPTAKAKKCKICGKELTRLGSHLKTHGLTYKEYWTKYYPTHQELIQFFDEYYITVRYRFLNYTYGFSEPYTVDILKKQTKEEIEKKKKRRTWRLGDTDLIKHLNGYESGKTIGVYFLPKHTIFIGFDIDSGKDNIPLSLDHLNRLYNTLLNYGIAEENMFLSFSGGKGYHLDVFLNDSLNKEVVKKFYLIVIKALGVTKKEIELRGGGDQPYKLPLGFHHKTRKYCYACDQFGTEILDLLEKIRGLQKLDPTIIEKIVSSQPTDKILKADIKIYAQVEEWKQSATIYENIGQGRLQRAEELLRTGVQRKEEGRHRAIREIAAYCKDVKGLCLSATMTFVSNWVESTWSKSLVDAEVRTGINSTVKSVYNRNFLFTIGANKITFNLAELREIFTIESGNKLQTEALRKLYFLFARHCKAYAYANSEGSFSLTYNQLWKLGANKNTTELARQIRKLEEMGKIQVVRRNEPMEKSYKKLPNLYILPHFKQIILSEESRIFHICQDDQPCQNCLYKAFNYLATETERRKYFRECEQLPNCPYNS